MTLSDVGNLEIEVMKKIGCSKEEVLRVLVQRYNQMQDMKFNIVPFFGKKLARSQYLDEEEIVKKFKEKLRITQNLKINKGRTKK